MHQPRVARGGGVWGRSDTRRSPPGWWERNARAWAVARESEAIQPLWLAHPEARRAYTEDVKFTTFLTGHEGFAAFDEFRKTEYQRLFPDVVAE